MSEFQLDFGLGREHILDYVRGYDHILFVLVLCAVYLVRDWKKILILVTAFTVGLSVTLGTSHEIVTHLLAFNLGLEFGQIIVVTFFLVISYILVDWLNVTRRDWKMVLSSAIAGIAIILMKDRI